MAALLLPWRNSILPYSEIARTAQTLESEGYAESLWRLVHDVAKRGDSVWVINQGRGSKGIFGFGEILELSPERAAGGGASQRPVRVGFRAFVDPTQKLLVSEQQAEEIIGSDVSDLTGAILLSERQSHSFEQILATEPIIDLGGSGDWTKAELRLIIADYFAMLNDEISGKTYSKTDHRNELMQVLRRSEGSLERKHHNISAVLHQLGLPWVRGYKPLANFQDALVAAVEERLDQGIARLDDAPPPNPEPSDDIEKVFVERPTNSARETDRKPIQRIVRKFDPALRDDVNRRLGRAGEEFVWRLEQEKLVALGKAHLIGDVNWASRDVGDGLGYDIESFSEDESRVYIEVKTTRGSIGTPFFISENERRVAAEKGASFRLYRVFDFGTKPRIYSLRGPLDAVLSLEPTNYRARVR